MITCPDCGTGVLPDQPPFKSAADLASEVTLLRSALTDILLLDDKELSGRQKFDHAFKLAERALAGTR